MMVNVTDTDELIERRGRCYAGPFLLTPCRYMQGVRLLL